MLNFPVPHPHELVYSTVARAGVYLGISSPKQLLEEVFADRKVIATIDLPCHLEDIARQLQKTGRFSVADLAYQHTLFPLYAPFTTQDRKERALQLMAGRSQGAVHLMLGVAASRVKSPDGFRFCPECIKLQLQVYGECFWQRDWFLPGLTVCHRHGSLTLLPQRIGIHRHQFWPLQPDQSCRNSAKTEQVLLALTDLGVKLLQLEQALSPTFTQWTEFYRGLAADFGFNRGQQIRHDEIHYRVSVLFNQAILEGLNLKTVVRSDACWLKGLFRKHRKAFSYLEHTIIWHTLLPDWHPSDILNRVLAIKIGTQIYVHEVSPETSTNLAESEEFADKRQTWSILVESLGVQSARKSIQGGACYAWLYRHNRKWLLDFNRQHKCPKQTLGCKVDWHRRDLKAVRILLKFKSKADRELGSPRMSVARLLRQLPNYDSISKNINKLPLVRMFLSRYAESVTEYQLRRLSNALAQMMEAQEHPKPWVLLRKSGLSIERLTQETRCMLLRSNLLNWKDN